MSENPYDCIIIGLGAMGSSAAFQLARRGRRVVGFDRYSPPHTLGSSHGESRIIREAYFEDPSYVPLLRRAYAAWAELESLSGESLFCETGGLMLGLPESAIFQGAKRSAEEHGIPHETLAAAEVRARFPAFTPEPGMMAVLEKRAGILRPEACIAAFLRLAREQSAELHLDEEVRAWREVDGWFVASTAQDEYRAKQIVFTAGGWMRALVPEARIPLRVERQVQFWLEPRANAGHFAPDRCPVFLIEWEGGQCYGFPDLGAGFKIALHSHGQPTTADEVRREVTAEDEESIREIVRTFFPDADGRVLRAATCFYTMTPDGHFWIDRHPAHARALVVSACSGHGFKFASVIGEIIADHVTGAGCKFDLKLFRRR